MENNIMLDAVENSNITEVYEKIKEAEPINKLFEEDEYNYNNVVDELVDIREVMALNMFKTITSINDKILKGRIKDKDSEKIKIQYLKTYVSLCSVFNNFVKDAEVESKFSKDKLKEFINIDDDLFNDSD